METSFDGRKPIQLNEASNSLLASAATMLAAHDIMEEVVTTVPAVVVHAASTIAVDRIIEPQQTPTTPVQISQENFAFTADTTPPSSTMECVKNATVQTLFDDDDDFDFAEIVLL